MAEIRAWADDAKTDGVWVELPAEVVLQLVGGFVQAHGVSDDCEVGE